jgi:hypothetical protein
MGLKVDVYTDFESGGEVIAGILAEVPILPAATPPTPQASKTRKPKWMVER